MPALTVDLPPDLALPPEVDAEEARRALAVGLFAAGHLSTGGAAKLAGLPYRAFVDLLRDVGVPWITYTEETWAQDLAYLRRVEGERAKEAGA